MSAPCRMCGVATDRAVETVEKRSPSGAWGGPAYEVGTCADCEGLAPAEPGAAVRAALRVLGKAEADWRLAADAFDKAGVDVAHVLHDGAYRSGRKPQRRAWGHVTKDQKASLRKAYVRVLDAKVHASTGPARPVPEGAPPPLHSGAAVARDHRGRRRVVGRVEEVQGPPACLVCGAGRSRSWRRVLTAALTPGSDHIEGHLCAACSEVHDEVGAIGATLVERAAMAHAGVPWSEEMRAPGLRAWVATGLPPGEPWAWVGEFRLPEPPPSVEDLARQVAALAAAVGRLEARP